MTQTLEFKPTFLQKLLGRNYKWWYVIKFNLKSNTSGLVGQVFVLGSEIVQNLTVAYVWIINSSSSSVITYLVVGRIYKAITDTIFSDTLGNAINTGRIVNYLITPQSYLKLSFFSNLGKRLILNSTRAISFLIPVIIFFEYIDNFNYRFLILLPFLLIHSYLISYLHEFIFGSLAFFVNEPRTWLNIQRSYYGVVGVLSGIIIPLDRLPLADFLQILPTSFFLHHPMQIYLGKYSLIDTLYVFLGGITWCIILYFLAKFVFKLGLKRN